MELTNKKNCFRKIFKNEIIKLEMVSVNDNIELKNKNYTKLFDTCKHNKLFTTTLILVYNIIIDITLCST